MYGEVAGYTISIWYDEEKVCELEPIGPLETLKPGESASFTENWWLFPYKYPNDKNVRIDFVDAIGDAWEEYRT